MTKYASKTKVSSHQSKAEIEKVLTKYGADQFMYGSDVNKAVVAFRMLDRHIKFLIPVPSRADPEFTEYQRGYSTFERSGDAAERLYEQAVRQRWRALLLVIKAKLEAVESGISEFEDEFLAHIVLPNGQTMGMLAKPQIKQAYETGDMPPLLGHDGGAS